MPQDALGPAVAGTWYPDDRETLASEVDSLLSAARGDGAAERPAIRAVIAPHAGFVYSGAVAAAGFTGLRGAPARTVIVIGPSHYSAFEGAVIPESTGYVTPLGPMPVSVAAAQELSRKDGFRIDDGPFRPEHSLEAEFPFLQRVLPDGFALVPVLIGAGSGRQALDQVARGLRELTDRGALTIVSSDFTHYGKRFGYVPFHADVPRRIRELDHGAVERILALDRDGFADYVERTGATICGHGPIEVLLRMLPAGTPGELAAYDTSGRISGDWSLSVSYASIVFRAAGADDEMFR